MVHKSRDGKDLMRGQNLLKNMD